MLGGVGCFALFFPLYGLLQDINLIYALRVAQGIAHAAFLAASAAYIADLAPAARRGEVIGVYGTASVVAMALFPAGGIDIIHYTQSFTVLFACAAAAAAAAFLAVAAAGEISSPDGGKRPVSLLAVSRRRTVLVPSLALFAGAAAYGTVITFLPVYAPQRGLADFGIFFTVYAAGTLASRIFAGRLSDRWGRRRVILPFMLLLAAGVFALPLSNSLALLVPSSASRFRLRLRAPSCPPHALVRRTKPARRARAAALGFFTSFMERGSLPAPFCSGWWGNRGRGFSGDVHRCRLCACRRYPSIALFGEKERY
jgi:predicted MFS family arabinose efflux permease